MSKCKNCIFWDKLKNKCPKREIKLSRGRKRRCESFKENLVETQGKQIETIKGYWQYKLLQKEVKRQESRLDKGIKPKEGEREREGKLTPILTDEDLTPILSNGKEV